VITEAAVTAALAAGVERRRNLEEGMKAIVDLNRLTAYAVNIMRVDVL
jgi:hypothetical protein